MNTKKKNLVLVVLLVLVLAVAGGYALMRQTLTINGTANIDANWKVKITNIAEGTLTDATTDGTPTFTDTSATFSVDLAKPGATATYIVTVANEGSIDAVLESVAGVEDANNAEPKTVTFSINAAEGDELNASATKDYTVTVTWDENDTTVPETTSKTATITLNYVQAD